jgi:patatin-like phospholipase/acyl hydrolase
MKSPIRILAVDGGGVGGIIPARLLERLQAADPRVVGNADLVAGTSTGGLIALGLARGLTPVDLCKLYRNQAKDIFSRANRRFLAERTFRAKFAPDGLRRAVEEITGTLTLGELAAKPVLIPVTAVRRPDTSHRPAGIFLSTAFRLADKGSALEKYASSRWRCIDVALATAAAPTYFPAHMVENPGGPGQWVCWDGGIVANNPGLAAVGEVFRLELADRNKDVRASQAETPDVRVLTLGTGYRDIEIDAGDWGLIQAARPVVAALMDISVGSTAFLLRQLLGRRAVRVSMPLEEDYTMDDAGMVDRLDNLAVDFAERGLGAIPQPDHTTENLRDWLKDYWFDSGPSS